MKQLQPLRRCKIAVIVLILLVALSACQRTPRATEPAAPTPPPSVEPTPPPEATLPPAAPEPAPETVTITFAADRYSLPTYKTLAEEFNATHTVRVVVQNLDRVRGDWQKFAPTPEMLNELASNVDTFALPESSLPVGLESGAFLDLSPLAESDPDFAPGDFFPGLLAHFEQRGGLWGLPANVGGTFIFYDKTLFDRAGLDYPAPGWTWDDFLAAAVQLTSGGGSTKRFGFFDAWGRQGIISFIQQHGGDLLDRAALAPTLDDPRVAEAVQWYVDLTLKHRVSPRQRDTTAMPPMIFIRDYQVAMWTDGLHNWDSWSKESQGQVGVAPFPEDQRAVNPVLLGGYFVSAGSAQPRACWQWLSFLTRQHVVRGSSEQLPARRSVFDASEYFARMGDEAKVAIRYALEHPAPPLTTHSTTVRAALFESLAPVWEGDATVEDALAQAQTRAQESIAQIEAQAAAAPAAPPVRPVPSPTPDAAPVKLTFLVDDGLDVAPYQALATQFSQGHPGVSVMVQGEPPAGFSAAAAAADCFLWPGFRRRGDWQTHVLPLDPFAQDLALDDFYSQSLAGLRDGGELWGLPLLVVPDLIYFNQDLFETAGVPYPAAGWRWDDFLAAAQALTTGEGEARQYGFAPWAGGALEATAFLHQHGATLADDLDAPTRPTFNTPQAVEALDWYADLIHVHQVVPPLWESDDPYAASSARQALIRSGRVVMWTDSPRLGDPHYDFSVGVVPLSSDRHGATDFDSWAGYVSAYSSHPALCWDWLRYLSEHLVQGPGLPARRSLAGQVDLSQDAEKAACLAAMDQQNVHLNLWRDYNRWTGWVYPWFQQAVREVFAGRANAAPALDAAQAKAEAFLLCLASPGQALDYEEALACAQEVDPAYVAPPVGNP